VADLAVDVLDRVLQVLINIAPIVPEMTTTVVVNTILVIAMTAAEQQLRLLLIVTFPAKMIPFPHQSAPIQCPIHCR
jgi:hypothetical protein